MNIKSNEAFEFKKIIMADQKKQVTLATLEKGKYFDFGGAWFKRLDYSKTDPELIVCSVGDTMCFVYVADHTLVTEAFPH